jgi:putative ABC transport system permease protein
MLLARKLYRELRGQKGQALAVFIVTALGVLLFVATAGAYLDLRDSYADTRARLALAELHVDVTGADPADVAKIAAMPRVRAAEGRTVTSVPVDIGDERVALRLISLPDAGEPRLDKLLVTEGRLPSTPDEIVVEKHLAQHHHLAPGSTIRAVDGRALRVAGIGVSAEYLWVARDEHDVMPSPDAFGVAWRRGHDGAFNQLLVDCERGHSAGVTAALEQVLSSRFIAAVPAAQLPGVRLLQMDVDGYKGMAAFFPLLFLGVGAFIVAALLGRLVDAQRPLIGTFLALGMGRARILAHYLAYALVLGGAGALVGAFAGLVAAPAMTREYAVELGIPFVTATLRWPLALSGIALGAGVALVAGALPALHACRLHPAEAMRPPRPSTGPLARAARRLPAALPVRMAIRDLLGRPLRSLGTALGVAAALLLVLTTGATLDSMRTVVTRLFHDSRRYDLRVDFAAPEPLDDVRARLGKIPGVTAIEGVLLLPVVIEGHGHTEPDVLLQGLRDNPQLLRSLKLDGKIAMPGNDGIVLTHAIANDLGVRVGDTVTARLAVTGATAQLRVDALADATLGKTATARRGEIGRAFGLERQVTSAVIALRPADIGRARRAIAAMPDVEHVEDLAELRDQVRAMMGLGWVMLLMMLACSVVLAAAILFNTATLGILERRRELATLRALGRTLREIALGLTLEHALLCIAGLALGFPLSIWAIRRVLALYSSDLFRFPFVLSPTTVATAASGIVFVLLLAQWPALRQVARDSLADAVRTREG